MLTRIFRPNLRARLVAVILLALAPTLILLLSLSAFESRRALDGARLESMAMAQLLKSQYAEIVTNAHESLKVLADDPVLRGTDTAACSERLQRFQDATDDFAGLSIFDREGVLRCDSDGATEHEARFAAEKSFYRHVAEAREFAIGDLATDEASGRPVLPIGYPLVDESGAVTGVLGARVDVLQLGERLAETPFYAYTSLILADRAGDVLLRHPDTEQFVGQNMAHLALFEEAQARGEGTVEAVGLNNILRVFSFTTIGDGDAPDLYVFAGLSRDYVYAGVERMQRFSLVGLGLIGLAAVVAAWLSAELMIVRRTKRVVDAALRMRAGDLSARTGLEDDPSELGELAQAFDSMAGALQARAAENERLIAEMQRLNADLEARVATRTRQLSISNTRLVASQAELRRLSEELMRAIEQERTRISREIHDQLGQLLTAIKMELRSVERGLSRDPERASQRLGETLGLVDETIQTVRRISADLRPGILDDFGLAAAIEWQLEQFAKRTGAETAFDGEIDEESVSVDLATAAFRIFQEALTNVARHAEATRVEVAMRTEDNSLILSVRDNGKGLHPDPQRRSFGVVGMRERARQFGGSVTLGDNPGGGTRVEVKIPLKTIGVEMPPG